MHVLVSSNFIDCSMQLVGFFRNQAWIRIYAVVILGSDCCISHVLYSFGHIVSDTSVENLTQANIRIQNLF